METLIMLDAAKRASAKRITVVAPYYPYSRQDKKGRGREPISARLVADLLKTAGADRVMSVDLHAAQIQGFFDGPVDHLFAKPVLLEILRSAPDARRPRRRSRSSRPTSAACAWPTPGRTAWAHRSRSSTSAAIRMSPTRSRCTRSSAPVDGRVCLLVDDMIDTGGTIVKAAQALKANGAQRVIVAATHAIFSDPAPDRLQDAAIDEVVVTDTIPLPESSRFPTLTILPIAPLLATRDPRRSSRTARSRACSTAPRRACLLAGRSWRRLLPSPSARSRATVADVDEARCDADPGGLTPAEAADPARPGRAATCCRSRSARPRSCGSWRTSTTC